MWESKVFRVRMKCGTDETSGPPLKISPLSIKQSRHARTIPILASIYFRPRIHTFLSHISMRIFSCKALSSIRANPRNLHEIFMQSKGDGNKSGTLPPSYRSRPISYYSPRAYEQKKGEEGKSCIEVNSDVIRMLLN